MAVPGEIRKSDPGDDFHRCPNCGYSRGFHCSFARASGGSAPYRIILICPECGTRFDIRWFAALEREEGTGS
jgi:DNA-directed RNA polymerase subunit RPC12/RpoP